MQKRNGIFNILFIILLSILMGLVASIIFNIKISKQSIKNMKDSLIISTFSADSKGKIIIYNPKDGTKVPIIKDRDVGITGDISKDGSNVAYIDALNDSDPWQVYIKYINKNRTMKLTDSEYGKVNPKFLNNEYVYFLAGNSLGVIKIEKVNIDSKESIIIDKDNEDRQADCFDVRDKKIIMSSVLNSELEKSYEENDDEEKPITHTIYEMNENGEELKKVLDLQANTISSISYNSDGSKAILSGCDINGDTGEGIYEISLNSEEIRTILNNKSILNTEISEFSNPNIAKISSDEKFIYFTAVPTNSKIAEIDGIQCYPTSIFRYDLKTNKIEEVYKPEKPSFIFDLNIKY